ncbi:MAG: ATP-dependent zinc metalloprotease FtsH [Spirochaetales bacterium]
MSQKDDGRPSAKMIALFVVMVGIMIVIVAITGADRGEPVAYSRFVEYVQDGAVQRVEIYEQDRIRGVLIDEGSREIHFTTHIAYEDRELMELLREHDVEVIAERTAPVWSLVRSFLPWLLVLVVVVYLFRSVQARGAGSLSFTRSNARSLAEGHPKIGFADVAGHAEAKTDLQEVVDFLRNPSRFSRIGARIPKGVLLVGMPGTGKTLLARAVAGEAGVNFFHISGSDFVEMYVGVGASRVRDLFGQGRKSAPCILFIDELDAVGRARGGGYGGGHDEREQTLNQLLVEMDGFEASEGVVVLAATNRPDVLDPALLRPGRFDRQVYFDMPDKQERRAILEIHAKGVMLASDVDLDQVARSTSGASGADLSNLVNEAALFAARQNKELVEQSDFEEARDRMLMGVARRSKLVSEADRRMTAYHEAGHALLHYFLPNTDPLHKVTIVPRGQALGVAVSLPQNDVYSYSVGYLKDRIKIAYGGYIAETLVYGQTSTGTQNDLKQATELARRMVCEWGMSEIGPISFGTEEASVSFESDRARWKRYSDQTAQRIDEQINEILTDCFNDAKQTLVARREDLDRLAETLVQKETLSDAEVRELIG